MTKLPYVAPVGEVGLMFSRWECSLLEKLQPLVAPETMAAKKNCA
jgi:hypothetical protein